MSVTVGVKDQTRSSMSPSNKRRPLSIIEENEDDGPESLTLGQAEKRSDEHELQKEANGDVSETSTVEVIKSPSFKAIKQFFIDKTESHANAKNKNAMDEKGKTKKVETRRTSGSDSVPTSHKKLTKTKSPDSLNITPTMPSSQQHHNSSSTKPTVFSKTNARIAPKTHSVTKPTTTTNMISSTKKAESNHHSKPSPLSSSTLSSSLSSLSSSSSNLTTATTTTSVKSVSNSVSTTKPSVRLRPSITAPTAATQAREQAVRKSSSFGAIDRLRAKTSSPVPHKVTKSNSVVGKSTPKKTVTKRDSTGSKDKDLKISKTSDLKRNDKLLDRSITNSPMSQISETDSIESSSNSLENAIVSDSQSPEESSTAQSSDPSSSDIPSSETSSNHEDLELKQKFTNSTSCTNFSLLDKQNLSISSQTLLVPQCDSNPSPVSDNSTENENERLNGAVIDDQPENRNISSDPEVSNLQNLQDSASGHKHICNESEESEEKNNNYCNNNTTTINNNNSNNTLNLNNSNNISEVGDHLQIPLSVSVSSSPPTPLIQISPSPLSPSLSHNYSPRSPKLLSKFRTSPTLSRRISIERNNNKSTTLSGKLITLPSISGSNTFPKSISREGSLTDFTSLEDSKDIGFILDKSRLASTVSGGPLIANIYRSARRGSYFFKRQQSNESLSSLSESEILDNNCDDVSPISAADLNKLKETADRLHLTTRRASIMTWRQTYMDGPGVPRKPPDLNAGDASDENLTVERKQKINDALDWLRNELQDMKTQDQALARQLLTIREDIHQLKLQHYTAEHQNLLDDFKSELEELEEYSDVLDLPHPIYEDNPLKHIGITRLNMNARRFSAC